MNSLFLSKGMIENLDLLEVIDDLVLWMLVLGWNLLLVVDSNWMMTADRNQFVVDDLFELIYWSHRFDYYNLWILEVVVQLLELVWRISQNDQIEFQYLLMSHLYIVALIDWHVI